MADSDLTRSAVTGVERATVVHRDKTVALRDVTLLAQPGELLAVLGQIRHQVALDFSGSSPGLRQLARPRPPVRHP